MPALHFILRRMKMQEQLIPQLAEKAVSGDKSAFDKLYELSCRSIYLTCVGLLRNKSDIEDIMQETYLTAFEKLNTLSRHDKFIPWINRIAVNKCKNYLMKKPGLSLEEQNADVEALIDEELTLPEDYLANKKKQKIIMDIIDNLPLAQKQVILLYYFSDMTVRKISEFTGAAESTVKYCLISARSKIKDEILKYEERTDDRLHAVLPFGVLPGEASQQIELPMNLAFSGSFEALSGAGNSAAGSSAHH